VLLGERVLIAPNCGCGGGQGGAEQDGGEGRNTVPFYSIRMSQVTGLKIYEIFRTGHRSPSHVRILKTSHEIAVKWLKN
jgi:hypothetical protein